MDIETVISTVERTIEGVESGEIKPDKGAAIANLCQAWVASRKYAYISRRDKHTNDKNGGRYDYRS